MRTTKALTTIGAVCLFVFALLSAGCATSRSYPGPVHGLTFNGSVKAIDLKEHRLTVAPLKPGEPVAFSWSDTTKIWKQGMPIKADVLETNWPVRIHYHTESGQLIAHHVYVELVYPAIH